MHVSISIDVMSQNLPLPLRAHLTLRLKLQGAAVKAPPPPPLRREGGIWEPDLEASCLTPPRKENGTLCAPGKGRDKVGAAVKAPGQVLTWRARGVHREPPRQVARGPKAGVAASRLRWKESTSRLTKPCRQLRSSSRHCPAFTQFLYSAQFRRSASSDSTIFH